VNEDPSIEAALSLLGRFHGATPRMVGTPLVPKNVRQTWPIHFLIFSAGRPFEYEEFA